MQLGRAELVEPGDETVHTRPCETLNRRLGDDPNCDRKERGSRLGL
jgi:hypothetical protein